MTDTLTKLRELSASMKTDAAALRRERIDVCCVGTYEYAAARIDAIVRESEAQVPVAATPDGARARAERLEEALRGWWEARRPVGWTEEQHRSCPHVNLATNAEKALATALLEQLGGGDEQQ